MCGRNQDGSGENSKSDNCEAQKERKQVSSDIQQAAANSTGCREELLPIHTLQEIMD